jgi:anti-anti-sigma factor
MSIQSSIVDQGRSVRISVTGRFDFSAHQEFRASYEGLQSIPTTIEVDMRDATYLDSSALGMLLLLRDYAGGDSAAIRITHCNHDVRKILSISNFDQLFDIE